MKLVSLLLSVCSHVKSASKLKVFTLFSFLFFLIASIVDQTEYLSNFIDHYTFKVFIMLNFK